jgi:hypothetical protein
MKRGIFVLFRKILFPTAASYERKGEADDSPLLKIENRFALVLICTNRFTLVLICTKIDSHWSRPVLNVIFSTEHGFSLVEICTNYPQAPRLCLCRWLPVGCLPDKPTQRSLVFRRRDIFEVSSTIADLLLLSSEEPSISSFRLPYLKETSFSLWKNESTTDRNQNLISRRVLDNGRSSRCRRNPLQ